MKIKTQEGIRIIEILSAISLNLLSNVFIKDNSTLNLLAPLALDIYFLDAIFANYTEKGTKEYRDLKRLYGELVAITSDFYKTNGFNDPVSIYVLYIYMYRLGLFSHDKAFTYSIDMKDFPELNGIDVVRGTGVCRSIAGMLTDIYHKCDYESQNLAVNVNAGTLDKVNGINPIPLSRAEKVDNKISVKLFSNVKLIANHQITMVQDNKYNYILDPTNDLFLISNGNKLMMDDNNYMKIDNYTNTIQKIFGYDHNSYSFITDKMLLKRPTISRSEYQRRYLDILKLCLENEKLFDEFYLHNQKLIDGIYEISNSTHSALKRKVPFLPIK